MISKAQIFFLGTCSFSALIVYNVHKYQADERTVLFNFHLFDKKKFLNTKNKLDLYSVFVRAFTKTSRDDPPANPRRPTTPRVTNAS
jgi:hypothetical protein